jgi:DNA polymerase III subunit delta'
MTTGLSSAVCMALIPLFGHDQIRQRLLSAVERNTLPGSLLLEGPAGVGKQRLALWLGQLLLCEATGDRPCNHCRHCRYALDLLHPDLRWFFPRPRLSDGDADADEVLSDYAEAIAERVKAGGLYERPSGSEGIFVATVRAILQVAAFTPAMARRKVIIIGDAERMVPQEGSEFAANALLKLLEEPPADTTIILTSSEPGALLPTIRSRVVALRALPLSTEIMEAFAAEPSLEAHLGRSSPAAIRSAAGRPGALLGASGHAGAQAAAKAFLESALGNRQSQLALAMSMGSSKARGFFSEMLDELTVLLHDRARFAAERSGSAEAVAAARLVEEVERTKLRASGNVNPQLLAADLAREIASALGGSSKTRRSSQVPISE